MNRLEASIDVDRSLNEEVIRLRRVIDKAAKYWCGLDDLLIPWEGDIGDAMYAAVQAIRRFHSRFESLQIDIVEDAKRAGIDPTGFGCPAICHLMADEIIRLREGLNVFEKGLEDDPA